MQFPEPFHRYEVEFDYDKVRMKHNKPRAARPCTLHSLPSHLLEFWVY
jgi:hypothetical protein